MEGGKGLIYNGARSIGSRFEIKWEGKYAVTSTRSYNYGDVALSGTRDGILYFEADGITITPGQGGSSVYGKSFDPGKGVVSVNGLIINDLGIIYNNDGSAYTDIKYGSLSDVSLSVDDFYLSELNAQRLVGESGTISVSEQELDTITELFTIHADAYGKHTIYIDVKDVSAYSGSGVDTDKFIQGNAATTLGDDFQLYWGQSDLGNPTESDLTLIGSNESFFIWDKDQQDSNHEFQQISLYAKILSDDFAEYDEKAEITVWGGAGKTTYEWTVAQDDNTSFWKKNGTSPDSKGVKYNAGVESTLGEWSGPYARNSAGQHLSQTLTLQGYGGRIELDVMFVNRWEINNTQNDSIQIYVNGNSFSFARDYRSALTESTQSMSGYTVKLYPFNNYGKLSSSDPYADQTARISIEVPVGVESVQLGLGTTLKYESTISFLAIDNLAVIEPEITTYTLEVADIGPVLSFGRVGYLDSGNNFISTEGNISEGVISVVEILVRDGSGNSIDIKSDRQVYVRYEVVTEKSSAKEGIDFYTPKGVMSTENYKVENFIKLEPGGNIGYLYITPLNDAIAEGTEVVSIKLVDAIGTFNDGKSYRSYVVDGEGDEVAIKITDPSDQAWTKAISITQEGRDDDYIVASVDGKVSVDIRLRSAIEEDRNVTLSTGDILTFTKENWDIPQTVAIQLGSGDTSNGYAVINAESTDNTITLSNTYKAGDLVTATINGISVSYTVTIDDIKTLEQEEEVHTLTDDFRRNGVSLGSLDWSEQTWQIADSINGSLVANGSEIWRELPAGTDWNQATDFRLSYDKNNTKNLLIKLYKVSNSAKLAEKTLFTYNNKSAGAKTITTKTDSSGVSLKTYLQQGYNAIGMGGFAGGTNYIDNIELEVEIGPRYEDKSSASALSAIAAKVAAQVNGNTKLNGSVTATVNGNIVTINSSTFSATIPTVTTNAPGNGSWSSGDVLILSHDNTSEAKVLLFEGGSVVAEDHQFIVTKNADVLEGAQGQKAALTISRVNADVSRPFEVFIKSTNGNLADLRSEQVRSYRPLLTGSEREILQYEGVSRTDDGKGYTIEMWVNPETSEQIVQLLDISNSQTQFDSVALSGIYEAGDRIDITISDMTVSYIVAASDIGSGTSTTYTLKDDFLRDGRSLGNLDWSNQTWQNETSITGTLKSRGKDAWRELPKGVDWTKATDVSLSFTKSNRKLLWIKLYKIKDGIVEDEVGLYRYDRKSTKTETISSTDNEGLDIKTYMQQGFNAIGIYEDNDGNSYIDNLELSVTVDSYTPLDTETILDTIASNLAAAINNDAGNLVTASASGHVISIDPSATDMTFSLSTVATNCNGNSDNTQESRATASKFVKDSTATGSLIIDEQGKVVFTVVGIDETSATARSSSSIAANEWQHIAITHDGTSQKNRIYINGMFDAEADVLDGIGILDEASKGYIVNVGGVGEAQVRDLRIINKAKESDGIQASMFDKLRRSAGVMLDAPLNGIADTGKHSVGQPTESASGSFADEPVYAVKMNANSREVSLFVDRTDDNIWTGNTTFTLELKDNSSLYGHAGANQVTINLFDDDEAGFTLHKLNRLLSYEYEKLESNVQLIGTDGSVNEIVITPANAEKTDNEPGHPYSIGYKDTVILPGIAMSTDGINALTISGWFKGETEKSRSLLELETTDGSNSIRAIISGDTLKLFLPTSDGELEYNGIIDHDQGDWHFWAISLGSRKVLDPTTKVMVQQRQPEVWVDGIKIELTEKTESIQADIVESFDYAGIYLRGEGQQVYSTGVTVQTGGTTTAEVIQQMKNNAVLLESNLVYAIDMSTVNAEVVGVVASEEETWTKLSLQDISESGVSAEIDLLKLLTAKDDEGYIVNSSLSDEVVLGISLNTMPTGAVYLKLDQNEYADQLDITLGDDGNQILAFDETNYSIPQTIEIKTKGSDSGSQTLPVKLSVVDGTDGSEYNGFAATLNIRLDSPLPDLNTRGSSLATSSATRYTKIERIGDDLLDEVDTTISYLDWENNTVLKTVTHTLIDDLLTNGRSLGSLDWSNEDWQDFSALSNTLQAKQKNAWRKLPDEVDWTKATDFSLSFRRRNSQQLWVNLYKIENNAIVEKIAIRQYSASDAVSSKIESMSVDQNGKNLATYLQQGFNAIGIWQNKNDTGFLDDLELSIIAPRASGTEVEGEVATFRISLTDQNGEATINANQDTIIYLKKGATSTADWSDVTPATTHQFSGLIKYSEETGSIGELTSLSNIETLADNTSIKGYINLPVSGFYTFHADTNGETVVKINDQTLIHVNGDGLNISSASDPIYLREGDFAEVSIDYNHSGTLSGQEGRVNINWTRPDNSEDTQSEITGLTQVDQLHVVIPAGSSSIDLTIEVADDSVSEDAEVFVLEITEDRLLNINASVEDIYLGFDKGATLDGSAYLQLPTIYLGEKYTIAAWAKLNENSMQRPALFYARSGDDQQGLVSFGSNSANGLEFSSWSSSGSQLTSLKSGDDLVSLDQWHHLVVSVSGTKIRLFVDGKLVGSQDSGQAVSEAGSRNTVYVGRGTNWTEAWEGKVKDLQIYDQFFDEDNINQVLSEAVVEQDLVDLGLKTWYPLRSANGSTYESIALSGTFDVGDNTQASDIVSSAIAASVIGSVGFINDIVVPLIYNDGPMAAIQLSAGNILNLSSGESVDSALNSLWSIRLLEDITLIKGKKSLPVQYEMVNNNPNRMPETGLVLSGQVAINDYRLATVVVDGVEKVDAEMTTSKMVITKNDTLGIDIKEQDIALTEGADGQLQSIRLSAQPLETVTVLVQAQDVSEVIIRQNDSSPLKSPLDDTVLHLTFTPENWDMAQSFYIIAVDDDVAENKSQQLIHLTTISEDSRWDRKTSLSTSDGNPAELYPFSVIVTDNDVAGVITESITYNISKSANGFAYLALSSEPTDDVSVMVTPVGDSVNPAKVTLNDRSINRSESMVFNKDNWNIAQSIELTAVDDEDITGTVDTHVAITTNSNDPYYNNKSWISVNVRIIDNDLPTAKIVPVLDATENGSPGAFKIVLNAPAPNDVGSTGISVAYAITGFNMDNSLKKINSVPVDLEALVGSYTLSPGGQLNGIARIAPGSTESQVFIVPIDDQFADEYILDSAGNSGKQLTFELTKTAADSPYKLSSKIHEQTIYVNIINNDAAGVALIRSGSLLMATEGGEDAQLGIVLLSQPKDKVSVSLLELTDTAKTNRITGSGGRDWDGDLQQANVDEIEPSASVEFDARDWYIPQVISVRAKADKFREDGGLGSGYENTGIHSTKVKLQFQSDDDAYDSETKSQEHFTNSTEFDLLILDESLSENTAESISSTLDSLQEGLALLELPFLGSMDGKFGNPFDTITKKLLPLINNLGDNLTVDRLQSTIDVSGFFDTSSISVQNAGLSNAYIQLDLAWSDEYSLFSLPLDASLGIPGLGLTSSGLIDAVLKFDAGIGLHIPFSTQNGMDINLDLAEDKTFISAELELNLSDDFSFNGGLGFLSFQGVNIGSESTGMNVIFDVTLDKDPSKLLLSYKDLIAGDFDLGDYVAFDINPESSAQLGISATAYTSAKAVMPNVNFKLTTDLKPIFSAIDSEYGNGSSQYTISLEDISLDIGSFATDMLSPVLETVGDILNPIRPLVDAFYTDTKIFAALGMEEEMDQDRDGIVTPLDMLIHYANTFGDEKDQRNAQKTKTFLSTLSSVYSIIDEFDSLSGNGESFAIDIGSYEVSIDADPESGESASNAKAQSTESTSTLANTKNGVISDSTTAYRQKIGSAVNKLYSLGFSIPLIEGPSTVVDLLLGKDVDLFTWTIPGLESSLSIEQDFTLWPAPKIDGIVEGSLTAEAFITVGFDTTGFSDWKSKGFALNESWRAFDGFFVEDKAGDEVVLSADLGVGVAGSVGAAKATVTGGIGASLGFDLIDIGEFNGTSDGKLRALEIYSRIRNPLSLFDINGSLSAYLDAKLQVGIDMGLWDKWWTVWEEQFDIELFSFSLGASGSHGNGPISGSTIGFDANFNGRIDINEPAIQTKSDGSYSNLKIDLRTFDQNRNGKIDPDEGRQIAFGGQDTVGGHDVSTVMFAPYGNIISPLTTVYSVALMQGMDKGEAKEMIQSLFSIKDWDFTTEEPIQAIRNEGLIPNISARKAALDHTYMNWIFDKLIHEAGKIANLDKLPLNKRVSLTENYSLNLIEKVSKVDDFTDSSQVVLAYAQAMMLTLNNFAKEIGSENVSPELLGRVINNKKYFNSLILKSFAGNASSDDFLARLSVIKSQLFFRSKNQKQDYLSAVGAQLEMNAASRWFYQEQLSALEETGLFLSKSIIRLTQESDGNLLRSGVLVDIQSLLGDITLTDNRGQRDAIRKISVSTVSDDGTIKSTAYNPISGNGARFYDFDGDEIADYMLFSSAPDNQAQSPYIVGGVGSLRTIFVVNSHGVVATLDPNQLDIEAGLVISATLETRANSVLSIYYVVLDKSELGDVDEIFSDLDLLKSRSNVLFSSLETEDVTLPEDMMFNRSLNLVNGQAIRFFQVDNAELSELKSSLDARLSIIDTSDLIEGHRGVVLSSESGPSFRLELMDKEQTLNSLIGSMQDKAPILDFSYFTEATRISGELVLSREAAFDALTGFYRVLDQEGSVLHSNGVDVLKPGHQEYASMALHSDNIIGPVSNLAVDDRAISRRTFSLSESSYLAPYSIVNGNQYFGFAAANIDGINHFRVLGENTFGLEDMLGGGDLDFDDHVFKLYFTEIA